MSLTLKEQAGQSGLVLLDETAGEWNSNDWPPLEGGWREKNATVVLDHPDKDDNHKNNKRQTVVVLGGWLQDLSTTDSVLVLNLSDPDKQWQEGPPMNKSRRGHGAVVCNGGVYVMGGYSGGYLDCMERIDANNMVQSSFRTSTTYESHWTTLTCRLSTQKYGCCAVAVHNQYIVVMGGYTDRSLSSVDVIDTRNHTVTAGPNMTVPRQWCASVVVGHRIFVVGGRNEHGNLDSVEYIDFAMPCDNEKTKKETGSSLISSSSAWITHSELVLSNARSSCAMVAVGSCLVVAGGLDNPTVEVLDTSRNRVWNLPRFGNHRCNCSLVTLADQITVIGGFLNPSCATLPLLDKNSWCFRQLCEQQPNGWYHFREGMGIRDADISPLNTSTSIRKRVRTDTCHGGKEEECT